MGVLGSAPGTTPTAGTTPDQAKAPSIQTHSPRSQTEGTVPDASSFQGCLHGELQRQEEEVTPHRLPSLGGVPRTCPSCLRALPAPGALTVSFLPLGRGLGSADHLS